LPRRGRKRLADAEFVISQVKDEFEKKAKKLGGAENAAKALGVSRATFYNYLNGKSVPDLEVLRKASVEWGIKWRYIDTSQILPKLKVHTPEQYVFSFLDTVRPKDVEILQIGPKGAKTLQVTMKIRFTA
jgi:transcriptional regulator with XRE-family HTH domain